ncbi:AMP-binding protein [Dactylosporangium salmoneum]|uniref:ATP-dependent acyl-CoA ligase n=1 Tax=Dactylosporangium salmoneum TaxID=53361 RepID=A0ABP5TQW9_9ACTN
MAPTSARPREVTSVLRAVESGLAQGSPTTVWFDHQPYPLAELDRLSNRMASYLAARVKPGDRVGVMARNGLTALLAWWGSAKCGAIVVPYNTSNVGEFLRHQVTDSAPRLLVAQAEFVPELMAGAAGLDVVELIVEGADVAVPGFAGPVVDIDAALAAGDGDYQGPPIDPRDPSHLIYTSGTTGPSKACVVSHSYVCNMALDMVENVERRPSELLWTALPMFHLAAVAHLTGSVLIGASMSLASRFSVRRFWDDIERSGAGIAALMGSMLPMVAQADETEAARRVKGQLRVVSGSPVSADLAALWRERFGVQRVGAGAYGMTEASLITSTPPDQYRAGSAGKENDSFEVRIVDGDGQRVPPGTPGSIVCRPKRPGAMFDGYWRQPEQTLAVFRDLWFNTGDLGRMDEDGYLYFVDRGKDYLRRGGENISSYDMESVLGAHPDIVEVAVHAVPSALNEDEVKVTAVRRAGSALGEHELFEWCHGRVPRYAMPRYIEFRDQLPRNPVGRVLKHKLRAEGLTATTWSAQSSRGPVAEPAGNRPT